MIFWTQVKWEMTVRELIQFERLREGESLASPSGRFVLHYDTGGVAVVTDQSTGEVHWRAGEENGPAVGRLVLGADGSIHVEDLGDGEVVWRSGFAAAAAHALVITDEGDFDLLDGQRVRLSNSRTGPVEAVGLGDAAPVAAITGERFLVLEGKKRRTVVRNPDGSLQVSERGRGFGASHTLPVELVRWMEQPGTLLTWRILPFGERRTRDLCLVDGDGDGQVLWRNGMRDSPAVPPPAGAHVHGGPELGCGGRLRHQSLTSITGAYTLVHQDDGNLVLYHNAEHRAVWATNTWWAGDGWTDLTDDGDLVVRNLCGAPVWRSGTAGSGAQWLVVDDEGGVALLDEAGTAVWEVRTGPHGSSPAANPGRGSVLRRGQTLQRQSLTSDDGGTVLAHRDDRRIVLFGEDGRWLWDEYVWAAERSYLALDEDGVLRVHAEDGTPLEELGGPGDELVVEPGCAVLRRDDGTVVWRDGAKVADESEAEDHTSWLEKLNDQAYCVTVVHDLDPDTALRRFGADPSRITTGTWTDLMERADLEDAEMDRVVAAFALGPHTMLVEDNGYSGVNSPELSEGTFAVSCYMSINADSAFVVYRDGEVVADHSMDNGDEEVNTPEVREALAAMESEDVLDTAFDHDVELLCRTAGVRPTVADVTGPARLTIIDGH